MLFVDAAEGNEQDMNGYELIKRKSIAMQFKRSPTPPELAMRVPKPTAENGEFAS